jgi:bifunctional non-homologous end joining protein LigD
MAADAPDLYLTKVSKAERTGRIFIDYLRNDPTSTAVGPYSTRARPGAPVAVPLDWTALTPDLDPARFTVRTAAGLVGRGKDPWAELSKHRQRLPDLGEG